MGPAWTGRVRSADEADRRWLGHLPARKPRRRYVRPLRPPGTLLKIPPYTRAFSSPCMVASNAAWRFPNEARTWRAIVLVTSRGPRITRRCLLGNQASGTFFMLYSVEFRELAFSETPFLAGGEHFCRDAPTPAMEHHYL